MKLDRRVAVYEGSRSTDYPANLECRESRHRSHQHGRYDH